MGDTSDERNEVLAELSSDVSDLGDNLFPTLYG